jgi:hypothetical protein
MNIVVNLIRYIIQYTLLYYIRYIQLVLNSIYIWYIPYTIHVYLLYGIKQ